MNVFPYKDDNAFIQVDLHEGLYFPVPPSPFPVPLPGWHFGGGRMSWGFLGHKDNKGKVLADGARLLSQGHQVAMVIVPHCNIPFLPPGIDTLIPFLILGSSNESHFACSTVIGPDGAIAVACGRVAGINLACNDPINLPTSLVKTGGTVQLGFTWSDVRAGLISMVVSITLDKIFRMVSDGLGKLIPKSLKRKLGMFFHRTLGKTSLLEGMGKGVFNEKAVPGILGKILGMSKGSPGFKSISEKVFDSVFGTIAVTGMTTASEGANAPDAISSRLSEFLPGD